MSSRSLAWWGGSAAATVVLLLVLFVIPFPVHAQAPSITIDWTAPGDDGDVGTATSYEIRWSATQPDTNNAAAMLTWWAAATVVTGAPAPAVAGTPQSMIVAPAGGFPAGRTYYFGIRATDDFGNVSPISNIAAKFLPDTMPPRRIIDLRVR